MVYILGGLVAWIVVSLLIAGGWLLVERWRDERDRREAMTHHQGHRCCGEHRYGK